MRTFEVEQLESGSVFPCEIYTEDGKRLADPFTRLDQEQLDQLKQWKIDHLQAERKPLSEEEINQYRELSESEPGTTEADESAGEEEYAYHRGRRVTRPISQGLKNQVQQGYTEALDRTASLLEPISKGMVSDSRRLYSALQPLYESVWHLPRTVLFLLGDRTLDPDQEYLYTYSLNTALYAMLIARELELEIDEARSIGASGLVHDLGMLKIPQTIRKKDGQYTDQERETMRTHPDKGARMLLEIDNLESSIVRAVREHHEQHDGEGYPRQLQGEDIHLHARIVHLAMTFTAMTQPRSHRPSRSTIQSIQQILTEESKQFDPDILDAFLNMIGLYPVGCFVRLASGCEAMVVSTNPDDHDSPEVKVLTDRTGELLEERYLIDLSEDSDEIEDILNNETRGYSALGLA